MHPARVPAAKEDSGGSLGDNMSIGLSYTRPYEWAPLAQDDIRIMTLLPGQFGDPIRIQIAHVQLPAAHERRHYRLNRRDLQKTLPPGWTVHEIFDGRFLYVKSLDVKTNTCDLSTWIHPNPEFGISLHEPISSEEYCSASPAFEALSYVCGSQENPGVAFVETPTGSLVGTVSIGRNLIAALRHLRYDDKPRKLWADAICIHQADNVEKSAQVRRIPDVYRSASRVVAWLGLEADESNLAMLALEYLGNRTAFTLDGWLVASPDAQPELTQRDIELPYDERTWRALYSLLRRDWFKRRWVVQEISLANQFAILKCGKWEISWSSFVQALYCLTNKSALPGHIRSIVGFVRDFISSNFQDNVGLMMWNLGGRHCSDPRDRVFALLGIMPPRFAAKIVPDYLRSPVDGFRDVFLAHIGHVLRWELFGCELKDRRCGGPSWVADLGTPPRQSYDSEGQFSSGHSRMCFTYADSDVLEVTGLEGATVVSTTSAVSGDRYDWDMVRLVRSWEPAAVDTATYITGEPLQTVYGRTLLHNLVQDRIPSWSGLPTLEQWLACGGSGLFGPAARSVTEQVTNPFDSTKSLCDMAYIFCRGRAFMTTREGYIGLGPAGVRSGDIIAVILGCSRPLVLRPISAGRYELVGDSFVYGLHDAISLLGPLPSAWRVILVQDTAGSRYLQRFANAETGELTSEDPRLEPHPEWERIDIEDLGRDLTGDDPYCCAFFRNKNTGEVINYDPGLLPEALEARGVPLRKFALV